LLQAGSEYSGLALNICANISYKTPVFLKFSVTPLTQNQQTGNYPVKTDIIYVTKQKGAVALFCF